MKVPKDNSLFHTPLESDGRQRDVFPLPRVVLEEPFDGNVCRAVRQRVLSHHEKMKRVNMAIHALNSLYYGGGSRFPKSAVVDYKSLPLVQKDAIADIICKVGDLGPPSSSMPHRSPEGASCHGRLWICRTRCVVRVYGAYGSWPPFAPLRGCGRG